MEVAAPELGQGAASDTALALAPAPEAAPAIPAAEVVQQPEPETAPVAEMAEALPAAEPEMAEEEVAEALPATEPEAAETEMAEVAPAEEPAVAPEEEAGVAEDSLPEVVAEAETDADDGPTPSIIGVGAQPRIGSDTGPQPGFAGAAGVRINRLPSIGGDVAEEPAAEPVAEAEILPDSGDMPAIERYAVALDNPDGLPLVGVVLTDPASGGVSAEELAAIAQPVTVAIDPTRADAAERAAALRAAGLEIAILVPELPAGATASDMEVSYQVFTRALPDAVAIIGAPDAPFQSDRRAAQHVVALLGSDGRGLITYDRGLNPARQAAESKDVPNAVIYRQLDARGGIAPDHAALSGPGSLRGRADGSGSGRGSGQRGIGGRTQRLGRLGREGHDGRAGLCHDDPGRAVTRSCQISDLTNCRAGRTARRLRPLP